MPDRIPKQISRIVRARHKCASYRITEAGGN